MIDVVTVLVVDDPPPTFERYAAEWAARSYIGDDGAFLARARARRIAELGGRAHVETLTPEG